MYTLLASGQPNANKIEGDNKKNDNKNEVVLYVCWRRARNTTMTTTTRDVIVVLLTKSREANSFSWILLVMASSLMFSTD